MTARPDCQVFVNGARFADTGAELASGALTALTGLTLDWGRSTVVDQPEAATCSFVASSRSGRPASDHLDALYVGAQTQVFATADVATDGASVDTVVDGSFESVADVNTRVTAWTGKADLAAANSGYGAQAIRWTPNSTNRWSVDFAISPDAMSSDPDAWAHIPIYTNGEHWDISALVRIPVGGQAAIGYAHYASPAGGPAGAVMAPTLTPGTTPDAWVELAYTLTVYPSGGWIGAAFGVQIAAWAAPLGAWSDQPGAWSDWGSALVDHLQIMAPPEADKRVIVFSGRITDIVLTGDANSVEFSVTAVDTYAELANDTVGDIPWPIDLVPARVTRIQHLSATNFRANIDQSLDHYHLTQEDIDAQTVADLLGQVAQSIDAVLWSAVDPLQGFYIWFEDTALRQALAVFALVGGVVVISGNTRPSTGINLSACDVLADDVQWEQDASDVITRVSLTWLDQTILDEDGLPDPTETYVTVSDDEAIGSFGLRSLSVSTDLTTAPDGNAVANRILNRSRALGWHMTGLVWDQNLPSNWGSDDTSNALDCLDGTRRNGLPIHLSELPNWAPVGTDSGVYLEGGSYVFDGARWSLSMNVSPSGATGISAAWPDLDASWQWQQFDPGIAWQDCWGVGGAARELERV